jgi:hypothetical protein
MVGQLTKAAGRRRGSRRSEPVDQYLGPGDGSAHDDYVYAGWEDLDPFTRYGSAVPRIWTPAAGPLVPETRTALGLKVRATSWGYEVIDFARDILEIDLMPWQRWLLIHLLELQYDEDDDGPDAEPTLRFEKGVVLVARQNGKSTLSQVLALWFMVMAGWPVVLGTAQDLPTAEAIWEGAVALLQEDPELNGLVKNVRETNSMKTLILHTGEKYIVKAANRRAGRGLTGNFIMLDELREQQNWAAWSAITKTTQAQDLSLILGLSNAGDITSVVLRFLRLAAHRLLGDPDGILGEEVAVGPTVIDVDPDEEMDADELDDLLDDLDEDGATLFLAEWSAKPNRKIKDRAGWVEANPALGHRINERKLAGQMDEPEWVIRTEVLCQWPDSALNGPFPAGSWEKGQNTPGVGDDGRPFVLAEDRLVGPIDLGIDQTNDRGMASVVAAGARPDGTAQIVLIANRAGTDWIRDFIHDHPDRYRFRRIAGQTRGAPISPFLTDLKADPLVHDEHPEIEVVDWAGADLMNGFAWFFDAVRDGKVRHHISPPLDMAASTAETKRLQDGMVIDRAASPADPSPIVGGTAAYWLHRQPDAFVPAPPPPPKAASTTTPDTRRRPTSRVRSMEF